MYMMILMDFLQISQIMFIKNKVNEDIEDEEVLYGLHGAV